jgi:UDP-2,3-diacylglucosamine pyrophosphatase LpxH
VPHWVDPGVLFHVRIALGREKAQNALTSPPFARDESMSEVIRDWKRFYARINHVIWQEGYFDHRLRADERGTQLSAKMNYIRHNPVAAGLCARAEEWPWVIDPFGH